jgi:hypothetical protein
LRDVQTTNMNELSFYINLFNNREKAIFVWIVVFLVWALSQQKIQTSFIRVIRTLLQKKIITILMAMFLYVALVVWLLYKVHLWDALLVKDTILWLLGGAFVHLMNANDALQDADHFKKILVDVLKLMAVLEFVVNFYTFSFWIELILVPTLLLIGALEAMAGMQEESAPLKKTLDVVLAGIGLALIIFTVANIVSNYQVLVTTDNLRALLLPPLLTLAYLPFLYVAALLMAYETLFLRVDIFMKKKDEKLAKYTKRKILILCLADLPKLNRFSRENIMRLQKLHDRRDVLNMIAAFK